MNLFQNISVSNNTFINQIILKNTKKIKQAAQLFSTLIKKNVSSAANQSIRMISEGSCDSEDRSNDC